MDRRRGIHVGWMLLAVVFALAAVFLWQVQTGTCTDWVDAPGECTVSPVPRISAGILLLLAAGFALKAFTANVGAEQAFQSPLSVTADMPRRVARLLYRRDRWGLDYAPDVPPCAPPVSQAADAVARREQYGAMLTSIWDDAVATEHVDLPVGPDDGPQLWAALGEGVDADDGASLRAWTAARHQEFVATATQGPRHDPAWLARETMLTASPTVLRHIAVLPVAGDWLQISGTTVLVSFALYRDPKRFLAALHERLAG
ncbi:hypothetical protein RN607_13735 [Demequina capsici]|uniref:Uncharacterized protein n=1 Tax=Demequina capsici TaxID=3075620 RepID=A0AA96FCY5_9MICO|nr:MULTISPECIES: hypothetical protein [unclassified Demequina]WNM24413.1 hypothetical protein RN606_13770 [Demequina sp. OYTSA14]WNM27247.1 hypothetical protein RN607_13735 [Demequina sp. PMTSA13]